MFFSEKEKKIMEKLFKSINRNKDEIYVITFSNGDMIKAVVETCYETDNGLNDCDINFEEYHACAMKIIKIIIDKSKTLKRGMLIEINYHNYPKEIQLYDGSKITNLD